jgi:hypothetical protein
VGDLIDKQSDAIAKETFSEEIETAMTRLGHRKEAHFCRLIREFYQADRLIREFYQADPRVDPGV